MRLVSVLGVASLLFVGCQESAPAELSGPVGIRPSAAAAQVGAGSIAGKLAERIDAGPYSYLRVTTSTGDLWAAVPKITLDAGADVTVVNTMLMRNFESKTLNRTFPEVYFGTTGEAAGAMPPGHPALAAPAMAAAPAPLVAEVKVAKAEGTDARTIAELWAHKTALKEQPVTVRGRVVKFTPGILGRNWIHLQDGTGSAGTQDNDVTVTTASGVAAVGDVVTVKGVARLEKDFGAGYAYPLIIEDATVTK